MTARYRSLGRLMLTTACWSAAGSALAACPICFQVDGGPVVDGVRAAVIVLVAVTGSVLVGVAAFAARIARRQRDQ